MRDLRIRVEPVPSLDSAAVIHLDGRLTPPALTGFVAELKDARQAGRIHIILDLGGIDQVNSTALGALVTEADACRELGGGLAVCHLTRQVALMVEMLGLADMLRASPTVAAAASRLGVDLGPLPPADESITVPCPRCARTLLAPARAAGRVGRCRECGAPVPIPDPAHTA